VAIAGFGDFEIARTCFPSITTVGVDGYAIGRLAGEKLLRLRGGGGGVALPEIALTVVAREST
jgi:LacI family gluconate utilization system Gnt-I transcriptional repressor